MTITVRIYNHKNKLVARRTGKRENWQKLYGKLASAVGHKWLVEVSYGKEKNTWGEMVTFKNGGIYDNVKDAKQALSAFIEK